MKEGGSKKLINDPNDCVIESLTGFVASRTNIALIKEHCVVVRSDLHTFRRSGKIAVISGGGSGHEPLFAGFVGKGFLTAAVAGHVFTSPPPSRIMAALQAVANPNGTLVFVMNYTGDRLNFGLAVERARTSLPGNGPIRVVTLGEDTALTSPDRSAGRRGLAGSLVVQKIGCALAEQGYSLDDVVNFCENIKIKTGTIGLSLSSCSAPGSPPIFSLGEKEMELGLGVHGEPGVRRVPLENAHETIGMMMSHMLDSESATHFPIKSVDSVGVLINNLGGTSQIEMNIICGEVLQWLESNGITVTRFYCGGLMTSLEMHGFSISLFTTEPHVLPFIDAETDCSAWPSNQYIPDFTAHKTAECILRADSQLFQPLQIDSSQFAKLSADQASVFRNCIQRACEEVIGHESELNQLDSEAGDGDCGTTMRYGAEGSAENFLASIADGPKAILNVLSNNIADAECPGTVFEKMSTAWESATGGTTGPIYAMLLSSIGAVLQNDVVSGRTWLVGLKRGMERIVEYGGAQPGDRTMVDALLAAILALEETLDQDPDSGLKNCLSAAVRGAVKGADDTIRMKAKSGRASYVGTVQLNKPDPGARAVAILFKGCLLGLS